MTYDLDIMRNFPELVAVCATKRLGKFNYVQDAYKAICST